MDVDPCISMCLSLCRSILKQYLDGISVNDDVMNNPVNPLMVVNNRLQVGTGCMHLWERAGQDETKNEWPSEQNVTAKALC